jgi:cysteine desulfurase
MLANHETGVIQPVRQIASICRDAGVPVHTDATQAVGKQTVDFRSLGVDALTASAHKFHGPRGIGVLVARRDLPLRAIQFGGFQQEGLRPGTESIALPVGMYAALCSWAAEPEARVLRLGELRDSLESQLAAGWPELVIHGRTASRLPHVSNVAFVGLNRQALLMAMDAAHVAASAGSACASGSPEPSPTLVAMGCSKVQIEGSIRLSVGATTTMAEIDQAVGRILNIANDLGTRNRQRKTLREARKSSRESL